MAKRQVDGGSPGTRTTAASNGNGREAAGSLNLPPMAAAAPETGTHERSSRLNIVKDPHHFSYKVPGLLAWLTLGAAVLGAFLAPRALVLISQVAAIYMLLRILVIVVFYPVGLRKIQLAGAQARGARGQRPKAAEQLHHVVILPNYREPVDVLARTLQALAGQADARRRLTVVLAMEGAEKDAHAKAQQLQKRFERDFARVIISVHPAGLPGETPGKSSNQAWAARLVKSELVDRLGLALDDLTLTSCDSDSVFHAGYFSEIDRHWAADPGRYRRVWHAPMRLVNNIWRVPSPIRLLTFFFNLVQVSELADPLSVKLPVSTFTLSLKLAHEVGYWDVAALADDWNAFLRCAFGTHGQVKLVPVFLPTRGDAVFGETTWQALANYYRQRRRHAWGCQDVGYVMQQWGRSPDMPFVPKVVYLGKVIHDHVVFTTAGLVIAVGLVVLVAQQGLLGALQPIPGFYSLFYQAGNIVNAIGMSFAALYEHLSSRRLAPGWRPAKLAADILLWPLIFLWMVFLVALPTLEAQTRMMFGERFTFEVTPKQVN